MIAFSTLLRIARHDELDSRRSSVAGLSCAPNTPSPYSALFFVIFSSRKHTYLWSCAMASHSFADSVLSTFFSCHSIPLPTEPTFSPSMKDVSSSVAKASRPSAYPKKRPSPHGISKSRKQSSSPLHPAQTVVRRSPRTTKAEEVQRQREAQIHAMRRQGIYLEEEYQEDIKLYMHEMEVRTARPMS